MKHEDLLAALVKHTTKKTIWWSLNTLILVLGGRNGFYDDNDDDGYINRLPAKYKKTLFDIFEEYQLGILFFKGRYFVYNPVRLELPRTKEWTHATWGKMLGFPCSSRLFDAPVSHGIGAHLNIITEFGTTEITGFRCGDSEKEKIVAWFEKIRPFLELIREYGLFKKFAYELMVEKVGERAGGKLHVETILRMGS